MGVFGKQKGGTDAQLGCLQVVVVLMFLIAIILYRSILSIVISKSNLSFFIFSVRVDALNECKVTEVLLEPFNNRPTNR